MATKLTHGDAIARCFAHEARRQHQPQRMPADGRAEIRAHPEEIVRWMNEVDRAIANYRRMVEEQAAA